MAGEKNGMIQSWKARPGLIAMPRNLDCTGTQSSRRQALSELHF